MHARLPCTAAAAPRALLPWVQEPCALEPVGEDLARLRTDALLAPHLQSNPVQALEHTWARKGWTA